jgi:hypothetical protein
MTTTVYTMSGNTASVDLPTNLTCSPIHVRANWARRPNAVDGEELKAFLMRWGNEQEQLHASAVEWLSQPNRIR